MKIQKTNQELIDFSTIADLYIKNNKGSENKLCSAITQFGKQLRKIFEDYNDERDTFQLNNCSVDDKTKVILKDAQGARQFTVAAEIKLKGELKVLSQKVIDCHSRIPEGIDDLILTLTEIEKDAFSGIIIPEQPKFEE